MGFVRNPRRAVHLRAGSITALLKTWYVLFTTDVVLCLIGIIQVKEDEMWLVL